MKECAICGKPLTGGVVVHQSCVPYWRSAEEPPEFADEVLVCTKSKNGMRNIDKGYYFVDRWVHRGTAEVTHWMPLPELPEEIRR